MQVPSVSYGVQQPILRGDVNSYGSENRRGISVVNVAGGGHLPPYPSAFHTTAGAAGGVTAGPWEMEHDYSEIPPAGTSSVSSASTAIMDPPPLQQEPFHIQDLKGMNYRHYHSQYPHHNLNYHPATQHYDEDDYDCNNEVGVGGQQQQPRPSLPPLPPLSGSSGSASGSSGLGSGSSGLQTIIHNKSSNSSRQFNGQSSYGAAAYNGSNFPSSAEAGTINTKDRDSFTLNKQAVQLDHHHQSDRYTKGDKDKMDDSDLDIYPRLKSPNSCICTRQVTLHVIIMVLAGIVYLTIGGIAGYYIGKSYATDDDSSSATPRYTTSDSPPTITTLPSGIIDQFTTTTQTAELPTTTTTTTTTTMMPTTTTSEPSLCESDGFLCRCGPVGGDSGRSVSHRDQWLSHGNVSGFTVQYNDYFIGWLQFSYGTDPVSSEGRLGYTDSGLQVQVTMGKDEFIEEMNLDFTLTRPFLTRLLVRTNLRVFGPFGGEGANKYVVGGSKLLFIDGQSGPLVNQITAYFEKCS